MKISTIATIIVALVCLGPSGCTSKAESEEESPGESGHFEHTIVVTSPVRKDVISTEEFVCQIHSCQHIEVRGLERGYLEEIHIQEGQRVKKGELLFKIFPPLYQAKLDAEKAEAERLQIVLRNAKALMEKGVVSPQEIAIKGAELEKALANVRLAETELKFTNVVAAFDGIVDRQYEQLGSLIEEGDMLTSLSDNSLMWVYFNVPEASYLNYMTGGAKRDPQHPQTLTIPNSQIELKLANQSVFDQSAGDTVTVESNFDNTTGNILFRADFPNPDLVLRHGQTGKVLVHSTLANVVVIPQRAKFEILAKQYVFAVDKNGVVRRHDIKILEEQEDIFVIESGIDENDKIILEGIREVRDGEKIKYEYRDPKQVFSDLKNHAE